MLMDKEETLVYIFPMMVLDHEHDPDPELRPGPIDSAKRDDLFVGMIAGALKAYRYFQQDRQAEVDDRRFEARRTPKIGRNDPCPCGSGKKYKHCCGGTTTH